MWGGWGWRGGGAARHLAEGLCICLQIIHPQRCVLTPAQPPTPRTRVATPPPHPTRPPAHASHQGVCPVDHLLPNRREEGAQPPRHAARLADSEDAVQRLLQVLLVAIPETRDVIPHLQVHWVQHVT